MANVKQHLEEVTSKATRVSLIRRLAGTTWGVYTKTLVISTQALVFSAADYFAHSWSRNLHVKKVDVAFNSFLLTIPGCLEPTAVSQFPVLTGITPTGLRRKVAILTLARNAVKHD